MITTNMEFIRLLLNPHFTIFGIAIYYYAIFITSGMVLGAVAGAIVAKKRGVNPNIVIDLMLAVVPLSIIGARIYYILFELDNFIMPTFWETVKRMVNLREGGLAIYGGIIGGALGVYIVGHKIYKIKFLKLIDFAAPGLILGQAVGRWGNFVNQEAYGNVVVNPKFFGFPFSVFIESQNAYFQATFFYEFCWNMIGFALLMFLAFKYVKKADGVIVCGYFVWYGLGRAIIEGMRSDSLYLGSIRVSQMLSVVLMLFGLCYGAYLIYNYHFKDTLKLRNKKENSDEK